MTQAWWWDHHPSVVQGWKPESRKHISKGGGCLRLLGATELQVAEPWALGTGWFFLGGQRPPQKPARWGACNLTPPCNKGRGLTLTWEGLRTSSGLWQTEMGLSPIVPLQRQQVTDEDKSRTLGQTASILQWILIWTLALWPWASYFTSLHLFAHL